MDKKKEKYLSLKLFDLGGLIQSKLQMGVSSRQGNKEGTNIDINKENQKIVCQQNFPFEIGMTIIIEREKGGRIFNHKLQIVLAK